MSVPDAKRLKHPEAENARVKKLSADTLLVAQISCKTLRRQR